MIRTILRPSLGQSDRAQFFTWIIGFLGLIGSAVVIGTLIGQGRWLLLGFGVVMLLALQWPIEVALGAYVFLLPFGAITSLGGSGTSANFALGAMAGIALIGTGLVRKRLSSPPREALWWSLFLLWSILTTAWALQPALSVHMIPRAIALASLYLAAVCWEITDKEFTVLSWLIIAGGFAASCYMIYQYSHGITFVTTLGQPGRASLVLGDSEANPNYLGADLLLPLSLAVAAVVSARRFRSTLLAIGITGIISYGIFLTMSRGSVLALAVIVAIFLLRLGFHRRLLVLLALYGLIAAVMPGGLFSRIQAAASDAGSGRLDIWKVGLVVLKRYGIVGAGLGNFRIAYTDYAGYASSFRGFARGSHNVYLEAGVELGILGVVLLTGAFISHLRTARQRRPVQGVISIQLVGLECACWAMLLAGCFEGLCWTKSFWLTWTLPLMALGLKQRLLKAKPDESDIHQST